MKLLFLSFLFIAFFSNPKSYAQNIESISKPDYPDSHPNTLPPLSAFIDSAMKLSPLLKSQDASILIQQLKLKNNKKQWTEYFNLSADYQYGSYDNIVANQFSTGINNMLTSASTQNRYGVGISVKYPIFSFLNRHNNVSMAKKEVEISEHRKEELEQDLRKTIIMLYNDILLAQSMVDIRGRLRETSQLQIDFAEMEYRSQKISVYDLAKVSESHAKNLADYEKALYDLRTSLEMIQELTGIKLDILRQ